MHTTADIPYHEPVAVDAGDTIKWKRRIDHYSAAESWVLTYFLRGPTNADITASADGAEHSVTIASGTSAFWVPGRYKLYGYVTKAAERFKVYEADLTVNINPSDIQPGTDMRSWARICRDKLRAAVQGSNDSLIVNYAIAGAGRTIGKMDAEERIKWLDYFDMLVAREEEAALLAQGKATGRNILIRFNG